MRIGSVVDARPGGEARDHQIVERQREGQHPARRDRRQISGSVTARNALQRRAAEIHRRLLQAAVEAQEPRLHHHGDEAHGQRGVRDRHGPEAAIDVDRDEQQQQRQAR